jgi:hypothetical protein
MKKMVSQIFGSNSRSKRAVDSNITCSQLKQVGKGLKALNETQLADLPLSEFVECILSLGTISDWSIDQLSALSNLAFQVILYLQNFFTIILNIYFSSN